MLRWIAGAWMLGLPALVQAQPACGNGGASAGHALFQVSAVREGKTAPRLDWVRMEVTSADRSWRLLANYAPGEAGLGRPTRLDLHADVELAAPERANPEQIAWRTGGGAWFNPFYWSTPSPRHPEAGRAKGEVHYPLAQSHFPAHTDLLDAAARGLRFDFRRLDPWERELGAGTIDFPEPATVETLYREARARALANLRPCGGSGGTAPPVIRPAPPSPPPSPGSESPAMRQARACTTLRGQAGYSASRQPRSGKRMKILAQPVDCAARTVRRVYEMESLSAAEIRALRARVQRISDEMWCSDPQYRAMIADGWKLGIEIGAPDTRIRLTAETETCGDEPRKRVSG